jgi:hypothetical protein
MDWAKDGQFAKHNFLRGTLDEVFIIEGALSDQQIEKIYRDNVYLP